MSEIINIAICDDEKIQVDLIEKYVRCWASNNNRLVHIETFYNAESFEFKWSMDKKYDILLLDIEMPGKNGIELAKQIRTEDDIIDIIFITAISDYIAEGYDVSALNYLIKPIKETKLYECLDKAMEKIPKEEKTIIINENGENHRIIQSDILYIESVGHFLEIHTVDKKYTIRKNIGDMERELEKNILMKCHRSYIVGLKYIRKIGKTDILLDNNQLIPVSRRLYSNINMAFIAYFRGEWLNESNIINSWYCYFIPHNSI